MLVADVNSIVKSPKSPYYGKPLYYEISDGIANKPYKVHRDRLLCFPWIEQSTIKENNRVTPDLSKEWGSSIFDYMAKQIGNLSIFLDSLSNMAQEAVVGKYKVSGLAQMFMAGEESKIMKRLDIINESKSVINGVILDADTNEDYTRDSLSMSGMNGVSDTMMVSLSAVTGIPVTRLFGRSPSGLDASGESDLKIYYDMIAAYQKIMLTEPIKRLAFYINQYKKAIMVEPQESLIKTARNGGNEGSVKLEYPKTEAEIVVRWNPLYEMTEKERADTYYTNAEADVFYMKYGILSPEEVRVNRFVGGYNQMISVETGDIPKEALELSKMLLSKESNGSGKVAQGEVPLAES